MIPASNCVRHLPKNEKGRDFIVGDLHGYRQLLADALTEANFDPAADRLFSVGNLINKGPHSREVLKLMDEPWFHAVRGTAESLALAWLTKDPNWGESPMMFLLQGGNWIHGYPDPGEREAIATQLARLPLGLKVDHPDAPFRVAHALWSPVLDEPSPVASYRAHDVLWNSSLAQDGAELAHRAGVDFTKHELLAKTHTWDDVTHPGRITYCGRSNLYGVRLMHYGHLHLNGGLSQPPSGPGGPPRSLIMVEHSWCLSTVTHTPHLRKR